MTKLWFSSEDLELAGCKPPRKDIGSTAALAAPQDAMQRSQGRVPFPRRVRPSPPRRASTSRQLPAPNQSVSVCATPQGALQAIGHVREGRAEGAIGLDHYRRRSIACGD